MRISVFCGISGDAHPDFAGAAEALGVALASNNIELVYGASSRGLMGALADAALSAGGKVTGVIPRSLHDVEGAHNGLSEVLVTESLTDRMALQMAISDAFVAFPGGIGTVSELFEVWSRKQLGLLDAPIGILNVRGYFDPLLSFLDDATSAGLLRRSGRDIPIVGAQAAPLVDALLTQLSRQR